MNSNYTHFLVMQKTGKMTRDGAAVLSLTLYGNSDPAKSQPLAKGTGYSGSTLSHLMTAPGGNYEINLNRRGPETEHLAPDGTLAAFHGGIQQLGPFWDHGNQYSARDEWGDYRANLIGPNGPTHFYLHGKNLYFTEGRTYTHGCTTEPQQTVLKTIFQLDPQGVGEGAKNGRIAVSVGK
jgi:hypothetical protein